MDIFKSLFFISLSVCVLNFSPAAADANSSQPLGKDSQAQGITYPNWIDLGTNIDFPILHTYVDATSIKTRREGNKTFKTFLLESSGTWRKDREEAKPYQMEISCDDALIRSGDNTDQPADWDIIEPGTSDARTLIYACGKEAKASIEVRKNKELMKGHEWGFNGIMLGQKTTDAHIIESLGSKTKCSDMTGVKSVLKETHACEAVDPVLEIHDVSVFLANDGTVLEIVMTYDTSHATEFVNRIFKSLGSDGWKDGGLETTQKTEAGFDANISADDLHELLQALQSSNYKPKYLKENPRRVFQMRYIGDDKYLNLDW